MEKKKEELKILVSRDKWLILGLLIILFNPMPAGLIFSLGLCSIKETKKEGRWFLILSLFWAAISFVFLLRYLE